MTTVSGSSSHPTPLDSLSDADYVLALVNETFSGVPEISAHHTRLRKIADRLRQSVTEAPACPKGCGLMGSYFSGWRCNACGTTFPAGRLAPDVEGVSKLVQALQFYANGEHRTTLTNIPRRPLFDWDTERQKLNDAGYHMVCENSNGSEDFVEDGTVATEALAVFSKSAETSVRVTDGTQLWLWKNGDHYLAFDHLYPCFTPGGDPMTLGEPAMTAIFKTSFDRATQVAEPNMRAICEALGFDPSNHHNAAKCPYCRPVQPREIPDARPAAAAPLRDALKALRRSHDVRGHGLTVAQLLIIDDALAQPPEADGVCAKCGVYPSEPCPMPDLDECIQREAPAARLAPDGGEVSRLALQPTDEQINELWRQANSAPWIKGEVLAVHRRFARALLAASASVRGLATEPEFTCATLAKAIGCKASSLMIAIEPHPTMNQRLSVDDVAQIMAHLHAGLAAEAMGEGATGEPTGWRCYDGKACTSQADCKEFDFCGREPKAKVSCTAGATTPLAWLFECKKPGKSMRYASIEENGTEHWPVDQWTSIVKTPLAPSSAGIQMKISE